MLDDLAVCMADSKECVDARPEGPILVYPRSSCVGKPFTCAGRSGVRFVFLEGLSPEDHSRSWFWRN